MASDESGLLADETSAGRDDELVRDSGEAPPAAIVYRDHHPEVLVLLVIPEHLCLDL